MNEQFKSVFSPQSRVPEDILPPSEIQKAPDITISEAGIRKLISKLKEHKASGPDDISPRVLKELASSIAPILKLIFQKSYSTGQLPSDWKKANVVPAYKKGPKSDPANYRPISLTCICCKMMEHIIASSIMKHGRDKKILYPLQHGFLDKRSCETQLLEFQTDIIKNLEEGSQTDVLNMDFSKAFDKVSHEHLIKKMQYYGVQGRTLTWIREFLRDRTQCVQLEGERSDELAVTSGVPQGSVLGPPLFLYYINDIAENLKSTVRLFADDTMAYLAVKTEKDAEVLQEDLRKLGVWEKKWLMEFHPKKCQVLSITKKRSTIKYPYHLHGHLLEHVESAKYLGVTISKDFTWNKHIDNITAKASRSLGFLKRNLQIRSLALKERAYKALVRPLVEYAPCIWDPYTSTHTDKVEMIQRRAARYVLNRYHNRSSVKSMLDLLKWPSLQTRRKQYRLAMLYKISKQLVEMDSCKELLKPQNRPSRKNNSKSYIIPDTPTAYSLNSFFPRTIRDWNSLSEEAVQSPSLEIFKNKILSCK